MGAPGSGYYFSDFLVPTAGPICDDNIAITYVNTG